METGVIYLGAVRDPFFLAGIEFFEQGVVLSDACKKELEAAEGRVQVLLQRGKARERVAEDLVLEEE